MKMGKKVTNTELLLVFLGAVFVLALLVPVLAQRQEYQVLITPLPREESGEGWEPVDINSADQAALEALPGVGPVLARRIIAWREEHGPFPSVEVLLQVEGIGQATLDQFRDRITIGPVPEG